MHNRLSHRSYLGHLKSAAGAGRVCRGLTRERHGYSFGRIAAELISDGILSPNGLPESIVRRVHSSATTLVGYRSALAAFAPLMGKV